MVLNPSVDNSIAIQEKLLQEILNLKKEIDTKETNFFFSSLLTGKNDFNLTQSEKSWHDL